MSTEALHLVVWIYAIALPIACIIGFVLVFTDRRP